MDGSCRVLITFGLLTAVLVASAGCTHGVAKDAGTALLAMPVSEEVAFSDYRPAQPYTEAVPGCLSRTVYEADSGEGYRLQIRDLLVGPGQSASGLTLAGAAALEVRSGSGSIVLDGDRQDLEIGSTVSLAAGQGFGLESGSQIALTIRAFILIGE